MLSLEMSSDEWKYDLKMRDDLLKYVQQNLRRKEILDFVRRDFPIYKWSISTLARRLDHFGIKYIDRTLGIEPVVVAVKKEVAGPGRLLGYRALNQKLRTEYDIKVPRHLVLSVLHDVDPEGIEEKALKFKARKKKKPFVSDGADCVLSLDGHDKLMGFQNWTFPVAIYGALDTFSRKILYIFVWESNSDPNIVGQRYIKHLYESQRMPVYIRIDRGTETGKLATVHAFLINKQRPETDGTHFVLYGPSTTNKIERWWRELHERMEKFFKLQLLDLLNRKIYDPHNLVDRKLLAFVFIPVIQRECEIFKSLWNTQDKAAKTTCSSNWNS